MVASRRELFTLAAGAGAVLAFPGAAAERLDFTRPMTLGPFYPVRKPLEQDADLTRLSGHVRRAKGELLELVGRVLDRDGRPVSGAKLELWQANAAGRYAHHGDHNTAPLDPDFQGYGVQTTGGDGGYRFVTIKPGFYPAGAYMRAAHLHFAVDGSYERLVTQMYFQNDRWLAQDRTLAHDLDHRAAGFPGSIFGRPLPGAVEPGARRMGFDIVLRDG